MKTRYFLFIGLSSLLIFQPKVSTAAEAWITEVHNSTNTTYCMLTTNDNNAHKGEVKKGSIHNNKKIDKGYSNWKKGNYIIYPNDQLFMKNMGVPWYKGGNHYLIIWPKSKDDATCTAEPIKDDKKMRIFVGAMNGKDHLRFQIGGQDIGPDPPLLGSTGLSPSYEMMLMFDDNGLSLKSQNDNKGTIKVFTDIASYIDKNKKFIADVLFKAKAASK